MIYADYDFYTADYGGGTVGSGDFSRLAAKASAFIDRVTFGRAEEFVNSLPADTASEGGDISDDAKESGLCGRLKCCCCDLVETLAFSDGTGGGIIKSESAGSRSYTLSSVVDKLTLESFMYTKCRTWLPSEWLYRGVTGCDLL